jgi:hypothetical protein
MKRPWHSIGLLTIIFALGVISGTVLQKYYGFGNLLRIVGLKDMLSLTSARAILQPAINAEAGIPEKLSGTLSLVILTGQSNMSGRGDLPPEQSIHPRIFMFGNDYRWKSAREPVDAPHGQVDLVSEDRDAGFGPALAFATSVLKRNSELVIGLIPCAKGASSIKEWQRDLSEKTLYGSCLKRVRAATTMGTVAGMLSFQGETDALDPERFPKWSPSASSYGEKFATFVDDLRKDLSLATMPIVFAQLGTNNSPDDYVNWEILKEQQKSSNPSCAVMITTDDLALADGVHFTTESYRVIGDRYAEAFLQLTSLTNDCAKHGKGSHTRSGVPKNFTNKSE